MQAFSIRSSKSLLHRSNLPRWWTKPSRTRRLPPTRSSRTLGRRLRRRSPSLRRRSGRWPRRSSRLLARLLLTSSSPTSCASLTRSSGESPKPPKRLQLVRRRRLSARPSRHRSRRRLRGAEGLSARPYLRRRREARDRPEVVLARQPALCRRIDNTGTQPAARSCNPCSKDCRNQLGLPRVEPETMATRPSRLVRARSLRSSRRTRQRPLRSSPALRVERLPPHYCAPSCSWPRGQVA
jgi:hypothetical protein